MFIKRSDYNRLLERLEELEKKIKRLECPHNVWEYQVADAGYGMKGYVFGYVENWKKVCMHCGKVLETNISEEKRLEDEKKAVENRLCEIRSRKEAKPKRPGEGFPGPQYQTEGWDPKDA